MLMAALPHALQPLLLIDEVLLWDVLAARGALQSARIDWFVVVGAEPPEWWHRVAQDMGDEVVEKLHGRMATLTTGVLVGAAKGTKGERRAAEKL